MTSTELLKIIAAGEDVAHEFKRCENGLSNSVFETVCAFSNRYGGHLFLGVADDGEIIGVNRNVLPEIKKNFVNTLNNSQRFSPTLYITLDEIEISGRIILFAYVPIHSQVVFFLIGDKNVSVRSWIAREIVSNLLIHREYTSAVMSRVIIERARLIAENPNRSLRHGRITPENLCPFSKNPTIARFFVNIGLADCPNNESYPPNSLLESDFRGVNNGSYPLDSRVNPELGCANNGSFSPNPPPDSELGGGKRKIAKSSYLNFHGSECYNKRIGSFDWIVFLYNQRVIARVKIARIHSACGTSTWWILGSYRTQLTIGNN